MSMNPGQSDSSSASEEPSLPCSFLGANFDGPEMSEKIPQIVLSESQIKQRLETLFGWEDSALFSFGWQSIAGQGWLIKNQFRNQVEQLVGITITRSRFQYNSPDAQARALVSITVPRAMASTLTAEYRIWHSIGYGVLVPAEIGEIYGAGFLCGLSASWLFLAIEAQLSGSESTPLPHRPFDGNFITSRRQEIENYGSYGNNDNQYFARRDAIAAIVPVEAQGMMDGWRAGLLLRTASAQTKLAVRDLILSRLIWEDIGRFASFTLMYFVGLIQARSIQGLQPNSNEAQVSSGTLNKWAADAGVQREIEQIEESVRSLFVNLLVTLQKSGRRSRPFVEQFTIGFSAGMIASARTVFLQGVRLGYGIGYRNGFKEGYARGFRDGFRAGFRAGLGNFLDDVVAITNNVREISKNAAKIAAVFA